MERASISPGVTTAALEHAASRPARDLGRRADRGDLAVVDQDDAVLDRRGPAMVWTIAAAHGDPSGDGLAGAGEAAQGRRARGDAGSAIRAIQSIAAHHRRYLDAAQQSVHGRSSPAP